VSDLRSRRSVRSVVAVVTLAACIALVGASAPAGARVAAATDRFCAIIADNQGAGLDFDGLAAPEARLAAKVVRQAAKTGVPSRLKADLAKIASVYDRIASGESAAEVLDAAHQKALLPGLTRFGKYVAANCIATPTS
jgi:hypothetical protein